MALSKTSSTTTPQSSSQNKIYISQKYKDLEIEYKTRKKQLITKYKEKEEEIHKQYNTDKLQCSYELKNLEHEKEGEYLQLYSWYFDVKKQIEEERKSLKVKRKRESREYFYTGALLFILGGASYIGVGKYNMDKNRDKFNTQATEWKDEKLNLNIEQIKAQADTIFNGLKAGTIPNLSSLSLISDKDRPNPKICSLLFALRNSVDEKYNRMFSRDQKSFDETKATEIAQLLQTFETKYPQEFEALAIDFLKHIYMYNSYDISPYDNKTLHQDEFYRIAQKIQQKQGEKYDKQALEQDKKDLLERIDNNYEQVSGKEIPRRAKPSSTSSQTPPNETKNEKKELTEAEIKEQKKITQALDSLEQQDWVQELRHLEEQYGVIASPLNKKMDTTLAQYQEEYQQLITQIKNRPHNEQMNITNHYLLHHKEELTIFAKTLFTIYMKSDYSDQYTIVKGDFHNPEIDTILYNMPILQFFLDEMKSAGTTFQEESISGIAKAKEILASEKDRTTQETKQTIIQEFGNMNYQKMKNLFNKYYEELSKIYHVQ